MMPEHYPRPVSFFQHPAFEGERGEILEPDTDLSRLRLLGVDERSRARILSQFQLTKVRRLGRLRGEYLLTDPHCILAFDRNGILIKLNTDALDDWAVIPLFTQIDAIASDEVFPTYREQALQIWENTPLYKDLVVLGGTHVVHNYYHFSICLLPSVRHFADHPDVVIGFPEGCTKRKFQRDLLGLTLGHRRIIPLSTPVRVENPMLVYEPVTADGINWLRQCTGLRARRGNRLIYIARRPSQTVRIGGSIEETETFTAFLQRHNFETIDFGDGTTPVAIQIAKLDGARVILSPHGANLTNIAYLESGVSVIELLPPYWTYFSHMQISCAAGLNHFAIVCHELTGMNNLVLSIQTLEEALAAAFEATP